MMNNTIKVRKYKPDDAAAVADIYYNTIHNVNTQDYSKEQVHAWAPSNSIDDYKGWMDKLIKTEPLIAILKEKIVGFAEFEPNGHIDCFYVHHEFQGQKVGAALLNTIESIAKINNIDRIYAEVSITAKPFFEKKGFLTVKKQTVTIRECDMINYIMEKIIDVF